MSAFSRGVGRLGATCSQIFGTSRCGKVNQVIGGIALGAMLSFGILGLMYANGHLHLPHSFGWLQTAFDKIGHQLPLLVW